ncbi:hypothetical protein MXB_1296 [Myxobolus squamalis]|nr:hypothetical protein MXB_1296 [Myxobolus squamalis]
MCREISCWAFSREVRNPAACSHISAYLGRWPDFSLISG